MEIETVEIKTELPDGYLLEEETFENPEQVNQKPYKCGICGHRTTADTLLKVHMKMHFAKRLHQCHVCKESFSFVTELNAHILTHNNELNGFRCEHCGKDYFTEEDFQKHYRIHTKEKPYKCKLCQRCFSEEFYLRTHERSHHGEEYTKKTMIQDGTFVDPNIVKHLSDDRIRVSVGEDKEVKIKDSKNKRQVHKYSEDNLKQALKAIHEGAKIRETCRHYGVPRTTVQDRLKGRVADKPRRMGPDPVLSFENEDKIVRWIVSLANCGFLVKKQELINTVQKIVKSEHIKSPFKNGKPGETWYKNFLRRHPEISTKTSKIIVKSKLQKPVLFLVDRQKLYINLELNQFCNVHKIFLYPLLPNATHLIQPVGVSVFKPMKEYCRQYVQEWITQNEDKIVTKLEFISKCF